MCPVCSTKISEHRREELGAGIRTFEKEPGRRVAFITWTVAHKHGDDLEDVLTRLLKARAATVAGEWAQKFNRRHGVLGRVRSLENTHGRNGWHPHIHELVFLEGESSAEAMAEELRPRWGRAVLKAGLRAVNDHGIDVRFSNEFIASYIANFGKEPTWSREHELTKANSKMGKRGSRTPLALLGDYSWEQDEKAGALWRIYARTFKGKRQLVWSDGLRRLLGLGQERTDEEIAAGGDGLSMVLARLTRTQWWKVLAHDCRAEVMQVADEGNAAKLWALLRSLGIEEEETT
jgi:hypothetical protein